MRTVYLDTSPAEDDTYSGRGTNSPSTPSRPRISDHVRLRELELEMRKGDFLATA